MPKAADDLESHDRETKAGSSFVIPFRDVLASGVYYEIEILF